MDITWMIAKVTSPSGGSGSNYLCCFILDDASGNVRREVLDALEEGYDFGDCLYGRDSDTAYTDYRGLVSSKVTLYPFDTSRVYGFAIVFNESYVEDATKYFQEFFDPVY